jgi:hypothetical protein
VYYTGIEKKGRKNPSPIYSIYKERWPAIRELFEETKKEHGL